MEGADRGRRRGSVANRKFATEPQSAKPRWTASSKGNSATAVGTLECRAPIKELCEI